MEESRNGGAEEMRRWRLSSCSTCPVLPPFLLPSPALARLQVVDEDGSRLWDVSERMVMTEIDVAKMEPGGHADQMRLMVTPSPQSQSSSHPLSSNPLILPSSILFLLILSSSNLLSCRRQASCAP